MLGAGVSLLTGGPGTGKSRTVAAIVKLLRAKGTDIALAAPTGRAAKRLEELTDHPAVTVHRLLGAQGTTGGFARNEEWPLDADVVVVDEASMLDVELTAALLEACPDGTHLLLVGDPAQLPSIGPGHVLGDLIDSGVVPVTELTTLYRQAEGGAIARLATAVRGGELPQVDSPDREVVVVPATGSAEAARRVVQLVTDSIPRALGIDPGTVQVVTPVHRGPAGTIELNKALKAELNPGDGRGVRLRPRRPGRGHRQPPGPGADRLRQRRGRRGHRHRRGLAERRLRLGPGHGERAGAVRPAARLGDHRAPRAGLGVAGRRRRPARRRPAGCCRGRWSTPR